MLRTIRSGVKNHPEKSVLQFVTDNVRQGGVISGLTVHEKAGGANMSVDLHPGSLYVKSAGNAYPISLDSVENIAISLNTSANPLIGVIIAFVNLNIEPSPEGEGSDVAQFAYIAGFPATAPMAPTDEDIKDLIGTNNPFERLHHVEVGSQVTAITNENLIDMRRRAYFKPSKNVVEKEVNGEVTLDMNKGDEFILTMIDDVVLKIPENMLVGDWLYVTLKQDGAGTRSANLSAFIALSADMSLATGSNKISEFAIYRSSLGYQIYAAGKNY